MVHSGPDKELREHREVKHPSQTHTHLTTSHPHIHTHTKHNKIEYLSSEVF